jgi:predicted AlkP superfamily phosphohydrolase/phosphomutase
VRRTLIAIGLDSADAGLLDAWAEGGRLPNFARLRQGGACVPLTGPELYLSEQAWTLVLTGCEADRTGYWSRWRFDPATYLIEDTGAYDFARPPFYARCPGRRMAIVDVPQIRPRADVDGVQVMAWGARSARTPAGSLPDDLLSELVDRHGRHPAAERDHASHWNPVAVAWLEWALRRGIARRAAMCRDLLARERWDFFFTVFGETHSAGHFLWHLSQEHPLRRRARGDPMLRVFEAVDRALGTILAARPDADVLLFAPEGMSANSVDLPSTVFLPELLHRLNSGRPGLAPAPSGDPRPPVARPPALGWHREIYALRTDDHPLRRHLRRWIPTELLARWEAGGSPGPGPSHPARSGALFHQPPMWYQPLWRDMTCFALPSISQGYVRINVQGRERAGRVAVNEYGRFCDELADELHGLRDARTGRTVVQRVVRTRRHPMEGGAGRPDAESRRPDADLVVFYEPAPVDVVDTRSVGRIGPVPFARTGGHVNRGFAILHARGVPPAAAVSSGQVRDLAPTMLALLGAPVPPHLEGAPLFECEVASPAAAAARPSA